MSMTVGEYLLSREPKEYDANVSEVIFAECDPDYCSPSTGIPIIGILAKVDTTGGYDKDAVYNCILTEFSTSNDAYNEDPEQNEILSRIFVNQFYWATRDSKYKLCICTVQPNTLTLKMKVE